jgi:hypothetical protein
VFRPCPGVLTPTLRGGGRAQILGTARPASRGGAPATERSTARRRGATAAGKQAPAQHARSAAVVAACCAAVAAIDCVPSTTAAALAELHSRDCVGFSNIHAATQMELRELRKSKDADSSALSLSADIRSELSAIKTLMCARAQTWGGGGAIATFAVSFLLRVQRAHFFLSSCSALSVYVAAAVALAFCRMVGAPLRHSFAGAAATGGAGGGVLDGSSLLLPADAHAPPAQQHCAFDTSASFSNASPIPMARSATASPSLAGGGASCGVGASDSAGAGGSGSIPTATTTPGLGSARAVSTSEHGAGNSTRSASLEGAAVAAASAGAVGGQAGATTATAVAPAGAAFAAAGVLPVPVPATVDKPAALERALADMFGANDLATFKSGHKTLILILSNLKREPNNPRFAKIAMTNPTFVPTAAKLSACARAPTQCACCVIAAAALAVQMQRAAPINQSPERIDHRASGSVCLWRFFCLLPV